MSRAELQAERDMMKTIYDRAVDRVRRGRRAPTDMLEAGVLNGLARTWKDPQHVPPRRSQGLWAHHNKLNAQCGLEPLIAAVRDAAVHGRHADMLSLSRRSRQAQADSRIGFRPATGAPRWR